MQIDHHLLTALWDKAVTSRDYDKQKWIDLSNQILEANRLLSKSEKDQCGTTRRALDTCRPLERK